MHSWGWGSSRKRILKRRTHRKASGQGASWPSPPSLPWAHKGRRGLWGNPPHHPLRHKWNKCPEGVGTRRGPQMAKRWPERGSCQPLDPSASSSSPWCSLCNPLWQESSHSDPWPWHPQPRPPCLQRPQGTCPAGLRSRGWTRHRCDRPCSCSAAPPSAAGGAWSVRRLSVRERGTRSGLLRAGAALWHS